MEWQEKNIIFIISLPRSGSTMLQRLLAMHPSVCTTSESWLLLPQIYALKELHTFSEYNSTAASRAIKDYCNYLEGGISYYNSAVKQLFISLIKNTAKNSETIYLEKTPRNNLIIEEIYDILPNSKYIFLWRNPAAVVSSMIESFADGKWNLHRHEIDVYKGLENMINAKKLNIKNRIDIRYEDFVKEPQKYLRSLFEFIGIENNIKIEGFSDKTLPGRMGDKSGLKKYNSVSARSINDWKNTYCNVLRRKWLIKYLNNIGSERLKEYGYPKDEILRELQTQKNNSKLMNDLVRMLYGRLDRKYHISTIRRISKSTGKKRTYALQ
ncbi:MAG: sulfotransferase [Candidatus Thiodiazotropha taylori]|nr:sulfotransferase [Candidatus Thiodiazotropha taylori]